MKPIRMLIVEDEFLSRKLVIHFIQKFGTFDIAVNGVEAVEAIKQTYETKNPYDVVFLDIMMPDKDGLSVLKDVRDYEAEKGINPTEGLKIIMTTALGDAKSVMNAFRNQCEAYITKPYTEEAFTNQLRKLALID
jgi:two-component system chemotaxis response regulator CheY